MGGFIGNGDLDESWEYGEGSSEGSDGEMSSSGASAEDVGGDGGDASDGCVSGDPGDPDEGDSWDEPNQNGGLEGGEIDDNELYEEFLGYIDQKLSVFGTDPMVHYLEIGQRHYIEVVDASGRHIPDAAVTLVAGQQTISGRTRADGQFAFFPLAYGDGAAEYSVTAQSSVGTGTGTLQSQDKLTITLDGEAQTDRPVAVEIAFILDATGSMGEEIDRIKTTITQIASRIAELDGTTELRFGLVDYRDRGDAYVTHAVDFTSNIEAFQSAVNNVYAGGGGDMPEELNAALHKGMRQLSWKEDAALRLCFVVADAPAHHYEQEEYVYDQAMKDGARMGVKFFPIASGGSDGIAELQFRQLAQFTQGHFIFVTEGNGSSSGSGGSDYDVDENDFQVEKLDDLIVRLVEEEVQSWVE